MNKFIVIGRLTKDIEMRNYQTATKQGVIGKGSIAVYENKELSYFFDFVSFDNQAKILSGYAKKGDRVCLEGKLVVDKWQDQQGNNRQKVVLNVLSVELLEPQPKTQNNAQNEPQNANNNAINDNDLPF